MPGYKVRKRELTFDPADRRPYKISRSKIDLFVDCPRCFYLDQRLGIPRTQFPAFTLNNAVDELLKREFDIHRAAGSQHPLMKAYKIDAVPFQHEEMDAWRDALRRGVQYHHEPTNFIVRGGVDDIWVNKKEELHVVDYKATSKKEDPNLDGYWQQGYKRQAEVYQWLLRKNGFEVSDIAYFVYVNGKSDAKAFDAKLEFDVLLIPYKGDDSWIEKTLLDIRKCLDSEEMPPVGENCEYCPYREAAGKALQAMHKQVKPAPKATGRKLAKNETPTKTLF